MKHLLGCVGIAALALGACTDFADVPRDVCGNGLVEAGEDCDSSDERCQRCAVTCTTAADCPNDGYACGVDGFCHAPGGLFAEPTAPVAFQVDDLRITDIDRDGTGDVVGVSETSVIVRHGDAAGSLAAARSFVTPAQSGPHAFGDLDGDGAIDVTLATLDGIVTYTSRFGTLAPVAIEAPLFDAAGNPLNMRKLFPVGQFELGTFVELVDPDSNTSAMLILIADLATDNASATAPCANRLGALAPDRIQTSTIDIYTAIEGANTDLVVSFLTTGGELCVTAIHGNRVAGYTYTDITPPGVLPLATRPVLADLDADGDPCPALVSSDGGPGGLRGWEGRFAVNRCVLDPGGSTGVALPAIDEAPDDAVAIGRIPVQPAFPGAAPDALVLSSGVYLAGSGAFFELYGSQDRRFAHVAAADLDNDGDIDAVLASADEDDLDVLYRFPVGVQLLRIDTASNVTSLTLGDYDGNGVRDIAYTEVATDHQNLMIAYGTRDRPLDPVQVAAFSGVSSVTPLQFPDSVDTLAIAEDLAVIHLGESGSVPTMSLLHGSPQRTMLSFFDPRIDTIEDPLRTSTILRGAVVGNFTDATAGHRDLLAIGSPRRGTTVGMRAWRVAGTESGLDNTPNEGVVANGLADCNGTGVCVGNAEYLAWPIAPDRDVVIAVDREPDARAAVLDPWPSAAALTKTEIPLLLQGVPGDAVVRSLYEVDVDGDGARELLASFASPSTGSVRHCAVSAAGVPERCDDLAPIVAAADPDVAACFDAAPGRVAPRGPSEGATPHTHLVVLCHVTGGGTNLYRVSGDAGALRATPLAAGVNLRALRVGDVTGDGLDDLVALQGTGGAQAAVVFAQCSSRERATCRTTSAAEGGAP